MSKNLVEQRSPGWRCDPGRRRRGAPENLIPVEKEETPAEGETPAGTEGHSDIPGYVEDEVPAEGEVDFGTPTVENPTKYACVKSPCLA